MCVCVGMSVRLCLRVCVCLRYIDKCKLCILAVLCMSVLHSVPDCVFVGEIGGGDGWSSAAFLIPFNSIRQDVLTCVEYHLLANAEHTGRGGSLDSHPPPPPNSPLPCD